MIVTYVYRWFCTVFIATEGFSRLLYCWEQGVLAGWKCCIVWYWSWRSFLVEILASLQRIERNPW